MPNDADVRQHRIAVAFHDQQQRPDCYLPFRPIPHGVLRLDEMLQSLTEGSTAPVVHRTTHAGIIAVQRYSFLL
jgi:hypothetical protein